MRRQPASAIDRPRAICARARQSRQTQHGFASRFPRPVPTGSASSNSPSRAPGERRREHRLADAGIGAADDDPRAHAANRISSANAVEQVRDDCLVDDGASTRCAIAPCLQEPSAGGSPRISKPLRCNAAASSIARRSAPTITGIICEPDGSIFAAPMQFVAGKLHQMRASAHAARRSSAARKVRALRALPRAMSGEGAVA